MTPRHAAPPSRRPRTVAVVALAVVGLAGLLLWGITRHTSSRVATTTTMAGASTTTTVRPPTASSTTLPVPTTVPTTTSTAPAAPTTTTSNPPAIVITQAGASGPVIWTSGRPVPSASDPAYNAYYCCRPPFPDGINRAGSAGCSGSGGTNGGPTGGYFLNGTPC